MAEVCRKHGISSATFYEWLPELPPAAPSVRALAHRRGLSYPAISLSTSSWRCSGPSPMCAAWPSKKLHPMSVASSQSLSADMSDRACRPGCQSGVDSVPLDTSKFHQGATALRPLAARILGALW